MLKVIPSEVVTDATPIYPDVLAGGSTTSTATPGANPAPFLQMITARETVAGVAADQLREQISALAQQAGVRGGEQSADLVGGQERHRGVPVETPRTNPARVVSRNAREGRGSLSAPAT